MSEKSVFEMIIDREIPAHILYEDDDVIAFLDAFPVAKGHTLVVPKVKVENIYDLSPESGAKLMAVISKVARALRATYEPEGLNVLQNNGAFASQSVFHIHFHLIPRYKDEHDGFGLKWEDIKELTDEDKAKIANEIKGHLNA
ncbi:cell-cycle regulation protein HIT [Phocicoccus schoeneichii]|uniref:HIT-like protein n=1 Tax=Phocicoccus schoeneichii TaxID=1812261 RepID=A0A6V7RKB5_9BACL|nr:HIT family protein [Jeotgalicoccus schoeneichii]GGH46193.1 cell-cycle regulation protein HIT [Jeotgalicoccus schoeneichii]CAD2078452.1 HIT-like protein [Jeotgalicoccus schoeneichii]